MERPTLTAADIPGNQGYTMSVVQSCTRADVNERLGVEGTAPSSVDSVTCPMVWLPKTVGHVTCIKLISGWAEDVDPSVASSTFCQIVSDAEGSVVAYPDSASSRA